MANRSKKEVFCEKSRKSRKKAEKRLTVEAHFATEKCRNVKKLYKTNNKMIKNSEKFHVITMKNILQNECICDKIIRLDMR